MNAGLAAGAYGNADNSEIVIAIRGTVLEFAPFSDQQGVSADAISTLGADLSFGGRIPNKKFKSNLRDAAAFLKYVQTQFPQANITLTGHSLGGAIAQILGQATNLSTYAFNSPGAENLYDALRPDLRDLLQCQNPSYISINYRILGDQVSKFGRPVGRTLTIKNPPSFQWTADPIYDAYQNFMALATIFFRLHSITTVISQIADNAPIVPAVGEPDYTLIIENNVHHN
jgi:pimeloyl-ACP methyl ester carboxylesterase